MSVGTVRIDLRKASAPTPSLRNPHHEFGNRILGQVRLQNSEQILEDHLRDHGGFVIVVVAVHEERAEYTLQDVA